MEKPCDFKQVTEIPKLVFLIDYIVGYSEGEKEGIWHTVGPYKMFVITKKKKQREKEMQSENNVYTSKLSHQKLVNMWHKGIPTFILTQTAFFCPGLTVLCEAFLGTNGQN